MAATSRPETTTTAVVLHGPKDLRIEQTPLPPPPASHLQIAIRSTTLCGSDLHYYHHFRNGNIICRHPLALGHESSGVVVAVPDGYSGEIKIGDMVALEVGLPCGECRVCLNSGPDEDEQGHESGKSALGRRYNICPSLQFRSSAKSIPHLWGTLQERVNHPAEWCHRIPSASSMGFTEAALMEPLAVAVHANRRSGGVKGTKVLVVGAGAVGLLVAAVAKAYGADEVVIADVNERRVSFAVTELKWAEKGHIVDVGMAAEDTAAALKEKLLPAQSSTNSKGFDGFDVTFECSGAPSSVRTSIFSTNPGGVVVLIGMGTPEMNLPISAAALREVDLRGSFRYAKGDYEEARRLLVEGEVEGVGRLVTQKVYGVERVKEGFEVAGMGVDKEGVLVVKVECVFGEEERKE